MALIKIQGKEYNLTELKVLSILLNANSSDKEKREDAVNLLNLCVFNTVMKGIHSSCLQYTQNSWKSVIRQLEDKYCAYTFSSWDGNWSTVTVKWGIGTPNQTVSLRAKEFQVSLCAASLLVWLRIEGI